MSLGPCLKKISIGVCDENLIQCDRPHLRMREANTKSKKKSFQEKKNRKLKNNRDHKRWNKNEIKNRFKILILFYIRNVNKVGYHLLTRKL